MNRFTSTMLVGCDSTISWRDVELSGIVAGHLGYSFGHLSQEDVRLKSEALQPPTVLAIDAAKVQLSALSSTGV